MLNFVCLQIHSADNIYFWGIHKENPFGYLFTKKNKGNDTLLAERVPNKLVHVLHIR